MSGGPSVDGMLVLWGERLFYPPNRIVKALSTPRLTTLLRRKAGVIRRRIEATLAAGPQVVVKVAGGGRGMKGIAAHFRYISRNGTLEMEDDRGVRSTGREALQDLVAQWRHGGARSTGGNGAASSGHRRYLGLDRDRSIRSSPGDR